jgi:hypothetical protein
MFSLLGRFLFDKIVKLTLLLLRRVVFYKELNVLLNLDYNTIICHNNDKEIRKGEIIW